MAILLLRAVATCEFSQINPLQILALCEAYIRNMQDLSLQPIQNPRFPPSDCMVLLMLKPWILTMDTKLEFLLGKIKEIEHEVQAEIEKKEKQFGDEIRNRKVR
jgi:hypothetical protein